VLSKPKKTTFAMSRRQRNIILFFGVLLASALFWLDHSPASRTWFAHPQAGEQTRAFDVEKYHTKAFTVINVVDGDTIDVDIPDNKYDHTRIRLWGVDTPETKNPKTGVCYFGPEAAQFTTKLVLGKMVTLYLDAERTRDKYDRLLAYVRLPDGRFLNKVLLTEGFAYADSRFRHNFYHKYKQLETAARREKKGLWEKVTPEQMPEWRQKENPNLLQKKPIVSGNPASNLESQSTDHN